MNYLKINFRSAKTRGKMLNTVTCRKHLPHSLLDNQQTHYDSVRYIIISNHLFILHLMTHKLYYRLLKGSAPGH
jgi:hypothetical protein